MSYGRIIWQYHNGTILWILATIIVEPYDLISDQVPVVSTWYQIIQHYIRSDNLIYDIKSIWLENIISDNLLSDPIWLYDINHDIWYQIYMISDQIWEYHIRQLVIRSDLIISDDNWISDRTIWYQIWPHDIRSDYMISDLTICYQIWLYDIRPETTWYQIWL